MAAQTAYGTIVLSYVPWALDSDHCANCGQPAARYETARRGNADGTYGCSITRNSCDECALTVAVEALRALICVLATTDPTDVIDPDVELDGATFDLADALLSPAVCCQCHGSAEHRLRVYRYPQYLDRTVCVPCAELVVAQLNDELQRQLLVDHMNMLELSSDSDSDCE